MEDQKPHLRNMLGIRPREPLEGGAGGGARAVPQDPQTTLKTGVWGVGGGALKRPSFQRRS